MNSEDAAVEVALLEIAKDLLQASDDLAATDPSASVKLAHEAYEIGRDLGIVRNHLEVSSEAPTAHPIVEEPVMGAPQHSAEQPKFSHRNYQTDGVRDTTPKPRVVEEDGDDALFRLLDRQREVVPSFSELAPARRSSRNDKQITFEVSAPKRSGWFSWMRTRDLRHAG